MLQNVVCVRRLWFCHMIEMGENLGKEVGQSLGAWVGSWFLFEFLLQIITSKLGTGRSYEKVAHCEGRTEKKGEGGESFDLRCLRKVWNLWVCSFACFLASKENQGCKFRWHCPRAEGGLQGEQDPAHWHICLALLSRGKAADVFEKRFFNFFNSLFRHVAKQPNWFLNSRNKNNLLPWLISFCFPVICDIIINCLVLQSVSWGGGIWGSWDLNGKYPKDLSS